MILNNSEPLSSH